MTHDRFVRVALTLIFITLAANLFRPQIQRFLGAPASAQEQEKTSGGGLHVTGDLIVDGKITVKQDARFGRNVNAEGDMRAVQINADEIKAKSSAIAEALNVGKSIKCEEISIEKMLSAKNAQILQALSAENIAVAKEMQVAGTAFIEKVAIRELKDANDALEASQSKIIDEIVARTITVLRMIEKP